MQPLMTLSIFASKTYHMSTSLQNRVQKKGGPCVLSPIVVAKYIKVSPTTLHVAMEHARRSDAWKERWLRGLYLGPVFSEEPVHISQVMTLASSLTHFDSD